MNMKSRLGMLFLIGMIALVGCASNKNAEEHEYSVQDVTRALESQHVTLAPYGMAGTIPTLNKVVPEMNAIEGEAATDHADPEFAYFYRFDTESARKSGVKAFNKQMINAQFTTYPFLYEKGNLLMIYWAKSKETPLLNEQITSAIESL